MAGSCNRCPLYCHSPRILVAGVAKNGIDCKDVISKTRFDVVLLDICLPDTNGTNLIDKIKRVQPEVKIIMITGLSPEGQVTKSVRKGANGFLLKDCSAEEMIEGILKVYNGCVCFSHGLEALLHHENNEDNVHSLVEFETPSNLLTPREIEIIDLVSQGLRSKEIALATGINVRTVDFHVKNILRKFKVNTRLEAVLRFKDEGLRNC